MASAVTADRSHGRHGQEVETRTPHFAHTAVHATDGMRESLDDVCEFSVWHARPRHSPSGPVSRALLLPACIVRWDHAAYVLSQTGTPRDVLSRAGTTANASIIAYGDGPRRYMYRAWGRLGTYCRALDVLSRAEMAPDVLLRTGTPRDALSCAGTTPDVISRVGTPRDVLSHAGMAPDLMSRAGTAPVGLSRVGTPWSALSCVRTPP